MSAEAPRTLAGYLDEVASAKPAPGGGSVAAIAGALGAGLGEMVTNLSVGRGRDSEDEDTLRQAGERLAALRQTLVAAATADERAYEAYREAAALPRGNAAEKGMRRAVMQDALIGATEAPLAVARAAGAVAETLGAVAERGNPHLRADAALGALLAEVALRGALLNVRGNAAMLRDEPRATAFLTAAARIEEVGRAAAQRAYHLATEAA